MTARCSVDFFEYEFPVGQPPAWHAQVERWYQLDAPAFGFCELWSKMPQQNLPDLIVLASPHGCNATDSDFAMNGASSPAKFVHTLPNVRASSLLQLMNWHGPMLCLQKNPNVIGGALSEALSLLGSRKSIWILGHMQNSHQLAFRIRLGADGDFAISADDVHARDDMAMIKWLRGKR